MDLKRGNKIIVFIIKGIDGFVRAKLIAAFDKIYIKWFCAVINLFDRNPDQVTERFCPEVYGESQGLFPVF